MPTDSTGRDQGNSPEKTTDGKAAAAAGVRRTEQLAMASKAASVFALIVLALVLLFLVILWYYSAMGWVVGPADSPTALYADPQIGAGLESQQLLKVWQFAADAALDPGPVDAFAKFFALVAFGANILATAYRSWKSILIVALACFAGVLLTIGLRHDYKHNDHQLRDEIVAAYVGNDVPGSDPPATYDDRDIDARIGTGFDTLIGWLIAFLLAQFPALFRGTGVSRWVSDKLGLPRSEQEAAP